jgi:hypothetical protein
VHACVNELEETPVNENGGRRPQRGDAGIEGPVSAKLEIIVSAARRKQAFVEAE